MDEDDEESLFFQPCNRSWSNGLWQLAPGQLTLKGASLSFQAGPNLFNCRSILTLNDIQDTGILGVDFSLAVILALVGVPLLENQ